MEWPWTLVAEYGDMSVLTLLAVDKPTLKFRIDLIYSLD